MLRRLACSFICFCCAPRAPRPASPSSTLKGFGCRRRSRESPQRNPVGIRTQDSHSTLANRARCHIDTIHFVSQSELLATAEAVNKPLTPYWRFAGAFLVFISPTLYFLSLILVDKFHFPPPPPMFVVALFFLIPLIALVVCRRLLWTTAATLRRKIAWSVFTLLAMSVQFGVLLLILLGAVTAAISYAQ